jgi:hypothetical protein
MLTQSAEEAIQVFGSMNDLSIRARALPVWLKSDPVIGLRVVEGMINRAEKTGATSCMMLSDLYRYKGEMLLRTSKNVEALAEIEALFKLSADVASQSGFNLSYIKSLMSIAKLQALTKDNENLQVTLQNMYAMYIFLKRNSMVESPLILDKVEMLLKINGFVP